MKALVYEGPRQMNVREVELPVPQDDEVLIRVAYSGICGSELSGYLGHNSLRRPPLIFGHEFAGVVEHVGPAAAAAFPQLGRGTRVTANPLVTCGHCAACVRGKQQLCASRKLLSASLPGSNAEFVAAPARCVYALPANVTLEQGTFVEPFACGVRAAELAEAKPGQSALVIGLGPIGLFALQALQAYGVSRIVAVDRNPQRLDMAAELGAIPLDPSATPDVLQEVLRLTGGTGADIAIDAVGASTTRTQCIESVAFGGRVIFTGLHEADSSLPVNHIVRREIACIGAFAYSTANFRTALDWIAEGRVRLDESWIVKAPLEEASHWYEALLGNPGKVAKVLLHP
ncbi:zinc-dependent alcohol dehydrogenase [Paenibacillus koleovorans]|uniref:zinc-dependent alcohol dehydrogenase n=1 Tax=Paenibacillus koleovorans TaxID=121608 RepID=UPI000FDA64E8|nr:galactitol-1-phosphate 5-dehydrogenase [Paenibacillus koleovorans]